MAQPIRQVLSWRMESTTQQACMAYDPSRIWVLHLKFGHDLGGERHVGFVHLGEGERDGL